MYKLRYQVIGQECLARLPDDLEPHSAIGTHYHLWFRNNPKISDANKVRLSMIMMTLFIINRI
jgi:hypothetical protein